MRTTLGPTEQAHNGSVGGTTASPTHAVTRSAGGSITGVHDDLAASLRAWRQRADPALAGGTEVTGGASRRTRGLRREEVAARAGISVNYLVRLEQGRAQSPSASVVTALARALDLTGDEAEHLHRVTGLAVPTARRASREITPSLQRLVDRFADVPLIVVDAAWTIVAGNPLSAVFLGSDPVGENAVCRQFLGPPLVDRAPEDDEAFERDLVGELHRQAVRHPGDDAVRDVIAQLQAQSSRFAALWDERPAGIHASSRKTFTHPQVGRVTVDCDVLEARGTDLRVVVWTAAPGTPDARALDRLRMLAAEPAPAPADGDPRAGCVPPTLGSWLSPTLSRCCAPPRTTAASPPSRNGTA